MKTTAVATISILVVANSLLGFMELERGELFLETPVQVTRDGNIRGNALGESDTIFAVDPTLKYERMATRGSMEASLGMNFIRFDEFSTFDSENLHGAFTLGFPVAAGSPLSGNFEANYREATEVDEFINDLVSTENTDLGVKAQYRVRPKLSIRGDAYLLDRRSSRFSDLDEKSAAVGFVFDDIWQDVGVTIDYRRKELTTSGDVDVRRKDVDNAIFVGLTGQILPRNAFPKLEAHASVSVQKVDSSRTGGEKDREVIGYNARLSWEARATTNVDLTLSKDVRVTLTDDALEYTNLSLGVEQQLSRLMTGSFDIFWRKSDFINIEREEDRFGAAGSLQYILGRNWTAGLRLSYDESWSTLEIFDYDRFQTSLYTIFRF